MSLQHFFLDEQVIADESAQRFALQLSDEDLRHARVARLSPGEHIAVIDADHDYFECRIDDICPDGVIASVASRIEEENGAGRVTLFQGIAKGDKMDSVMRQATELGVFGIVPLMCERSVVRLDAKRAAKRMDRWRSICKSASMQSGRRALPELSSPLSVEQAASDMAGFTSVIVCWEESDRLSPGIGPAIRKACLARGVRDVREAHVAVVVGPEGGLTPAEVEALLAGNDESAVASMGSTILRTETAGVVASALALYELGGLGGGEA